MLGASTLFKLLKVDMRTLLILVWFGLVWFGLVWFGLVKV
jgi:hypothetical protein